mmetsp:Transcript_42725/g.110472  ORF Transcript_42725/g.110472 Transcript_42725/m.110472 type:complete len:226 (+) Transcript_42725:1178-1855(+)
MGEPLRRQRAVLRVALPDGAAVVAGAVHAVRVGDPAEEPERASVLGVGGHVRHGVLLVVRQLHHEHDPAAPDLQRGERAAGAQLAPVPAAQCCLGRPLHAHLGLRAEQLHRRQAEPDTGEGREAPHGAAPRPPVRDARRGLRPGHHRAPHVPVSGGGQPARLLRRLLPRHGAALRHDEPRALPARHEVLEHVLRRGGCAQVRHRHVPEDHRRGPGLALHDDGQLG